MWPSFCWTHLLLRNTTNNMHSLLYELIFLFLQYLHCNPLSHSLQSQQRPHPNSSNFDGYTLRQNWSANLYNTYVNAILPQNPGHWWVQPFDKTGHNLPIQYCNLLPLRTKHAAHSLTPKYNTAATASAWIICIISSLQSQHLRLTTGVMWVQRWTGKPKPPPAPWPWMGLTEGNTFFQTSGFGIRIQFFFLLNAMRRCCLRWNEVFSMVHPESQEEGAEKGAPIQNQQI